ncbi:cell wall-binding repeat-containing protein [Herbiconiux sp. 11R-BC]|uniref:cell wall-binding repeat-containing protein n=1 Tax=Herbiconiux sp. 11R-BC TaxID=3111637 RepID=UPI003C086CF7
MPVSLSALRTTVLGGVAALLLAAPIVPALSAQAEEVIVPGVSCPQAVAVVGFPIGFAQLASEGSTIAVTAGALPSGLTINPSGPAIIGQPGTVETAHFTLSATRPGSSAAGGVDCTMTVKKAPAVARIAGSDRYAQAIAVSKLKFTKTDTVFVASGEKYADALSATAIAAANGGPLLLTAQGSLPAGLLAEITRLGAKDVVVVGGPASVSDGVVQALTVGSGGARVKRIGGADRYEVSRNLIADEDFGIQSATGLYIATGTNFPDALTASPAAAQHSQPVLLVNGTEPTLTASESNLLMSLGVRDVFIAGGPVSVSAPLEASLKNTFAVTRYAGTDRYEAGASVNRASFPNGVGSIYLASGAVFPDALSGGAAAGAEKSPLYVTQPDCLSSAVYFEIGRVAPDTVYVLGGTNTLSRDIESLTPCGLD